MSASENRLSSACGSTQDRFNSAGSFSVGPGNVHKQTTASSAYVLRGFFVSRNIEIQISAFGTSGAEGKCALTHLCRPLRRPCPELWRICTIVKLCSALSLPVHIPRNGRLRTLAMKKLLLASAATALLTGAASAADLPRRAPPPVFTPVPVFTWTGAYFGINAGYAFDASSNNTGSTFTVPGAFTVSGAPATATFRDQNQEGFSGGGQIGYNWQLTPGSGVVIGFEADAQYLDFGRNRNNALISGGALGSGLSVTDPRGLSSLDFFGTVRGRLGYAFDRVLVYGTGGFPHRSGRPGR